MSRKANSVHGENITASKQFFQHCFSCRFLVLAQCEFPCFLILSRSLMCTLLAYQQGIYLKNFPSLSDQTDDESISCLKDTIFNNFSCFQFSPFFLQIGVYFFSTSVFDCNLLNVFSPFFFLVPFSSLDALTHQIVFLWALSILPHLLFSFLTVRTAKMSKLPRISLRFFKIFGHTHAQYLVGGDSIWLPGYGWYPGVPPTGSYSTKK